MENVLRNDLSSFSRIDAVKMILATLSSITEMRVSLVARVTDDSWTACAVHDDASFGIKVGDELELSNTY